MFFVYDSVGIVGILHGRHEKRLDCDEIRDIRKRTRDLASRQRWTTPLRFRQTEPRVGEKEKWKCSSDICAMGESVSSPSPPSRSCTQSLRPRRGHSWVLTRQTRPNTSNSSPRCVYSSGGCACGQVLSCSHCRSARQPRRWATTRCQALDSRKHHMSAGMPQSGRSRA